MPASVIVETSCGRLRGVADDGLSIFRGVRFARAPVGALRFRAPVKPEAWRGVRDATRFGPAAPQLADDPFVQAVVDTEIACDEDCLTLNIWTPGCDRNARPVLVFIHGGGFLRGAASWPAYDAAPLARRGDVVVVTLQYRLGALGFLYLHGLGADPGEWPANLGLRDQIAALEWVRDEIAAFGGDPQTVTVFGQSAGAVALGVLLTAPRARGLFRRAVLQSGPPVAIAPAEATPVAEALLRTLGIERAQLSRLREVPVDALLAAKEQCEASPGTRMLNLPFLPVVDGDVVRGDPTNGVGAGAAAGVDIIIGSTRDEMTPYLVLEPDLMRLGEPGLQRHCEQLLTWLAPACDHSKSSWWTHLVESYRRARSARAQPTEPWALWLAIKGDGVVRCPSMRLAELQRSSGGSVFAYLFCWTSPFMGGVLGACHTLDLPFLLGDLDDPRTVTFTGTGPEARRLAERMQDAWIAFARTGNPSHTGIGEWPSYDSAQRATMILDRDCHIEVAPLEEERSVWDEVIQDRHASPNPYARLDAGKLQDRPRSLRTSPTRSVKPVRSK